MELAKGANAPVRVPVARVSLTSELPAGSVDLFALELTGRRRVRDDGDLVFYNQRRSADGCLWLVSERCVRIALDEVPDEVETIVVAAGLADDWPGALADDPATRVEVQEAGESAWDGPDDDGAWAVSHRVEADGGERCVVLVELYRRDGRWKVRAVSQGWTAGTVALLTEHGVHVERDPTEADTPAVAPTLPEVPVPSPRPLAPTRPLPPAHPQPRTHPRSQPGPLPPTLPYPAAPWAVRAADLSDAPTEIVDSPTGAWPVWRRPTDAPNESPTGPREARTRSAEPRTGDGGHGAAGGTRHLRVEPVARAARRAPLDLLEMDPYDFEQLVANLMTKMGYDTRRVGRSGDGGVDVEVYSDDPLGSGLIVISVKRYRRTVGAHYVRELAGTVADRDAIKGILVTTSGFGPSSVEFAAKNRLELVDGERLRGWLAEYLDLDTV
ncbi:restriction endonuclease [Frankia sp. AgB1.9]|uniref:restriction endonuclease n=1 Tax=unclassified Frankia TaxID=2632575 RepID=UPI00193369A3|nr:MULTISPECIES: restriction endonuclease [unclassified Frankia]MBL7487002.1 restriction endonuclease [Frankia sp. AgW1.1]MBL7552028.1 restriction endonuclease [Frankia sp. AgB1.9]MBL7623347.1 restriction endonuclease [Frankia sp. AgB1.8]